jgi:uncharacterized repeat protein (TIGR01451 family)
VANFVGSTVSVIDGATNAVTATIAVGSGPAAVGVDPATHTVYVANTFSNSVSVIDGATNAVTATIGVGSGPAAVGVDPVTHAAYVANFGDNTVSVITPVTSPDLKLSDSAPASAISGQPYSYTLTATNTGGQDATGVTVTDTLPASAHFDSAATTQGSCTRTPSGPPKTKGGTVSCTVSSLAAGASVTVTITVTPTTPGTVSDAASVTASNVTADSDDTASASTTVQGT